MSVQQMDRLEWDEAFSVGVKRFDDQHKRLIDFINKLREATLGKQVKQAEVVEEIIMGLLDYTVSHFLEEEVALYQSDYPYYEHHRDCHNKFLFAAKEYYVRFKSGTSTPRMLNSEMIAFLSEFLQVHILGEDQLYTLFLNEKGIT